MADLLSTLSGQPTNFEVGAPEPTDPANIANALAVYHYGPSLAGDGMDHHLDVLTASVAYALSNGSPATPTVPGTLHGKTEEFDANTAVGASALLMDVTGQENVAIGTRAMLQNTSGKFNTAIGVYAMHDNLTGYGNTAIGYYSLKAGNGFYNTAVGAWSLYNTASAGSYNVSIGMNSMWENISGSYNVAIGSAALQSTLVSGLVGVGRGALQQNSTGIKNVAVGESALNQNTIGIENTAIGYYALDTNTTGTNNTGIGNGAQAATPTSVNSITLGNSSIATLRCQVTTITALSDERDKTNIESIPVGLEFIEALRPVKFDWNMRDGAKVGVPDIGFIAQDLVAVEDALDANDWLQLTYRDNPEKLEATYGRLVPILVKAVQELSAEVKELKSRMV